MKSHKTILTFAFIIYLIAILLIFVIGYISYQHGIEEARKLYLNFYGNEYYCKNDT
jgi:hypothetical protein